MNQAFEITRLDTQETGFYQRLDTLLAYEPTQDQAVEHAVADILAQVRSRGDDAVVEYTARFDRHTVKQAHALELSRAQLQAALDGTSKDLRVALEQAAQRIARYHEKQITPSWSYTEADGTRLGQKIRLWTALDCMCQAAKRLIRRQFL